MIADLILAILHHVAAFGLMAVAAMEWALLRQPASHPAIARLARLDLIYGILALVMVVVGVLRLAYGFKGWPFFAHNPAFHAKLTVIVAVGLVSILPTVRFRQWRRSQLRDPAWTVDPGQWQTVRRCLAAEFHLLLIIPVLAAMAARGIGM